MTTSITHDIITENETVYFDTQYLYTPGRTTLTPPAPASDQRSEFGIEVPPYLPVGVTWFDEAQKLLGRESPVHVQGK
jgi:hypothetical protein